MATSSQFSGNYDNYDMGISGNKPGFTSFRHGDGVATMTWGAAATSSQATMTWGAAARTARVAITVKPVKVIRHSRSST